MNIWQTLRRSVILLTIASLAALLWQQMTAPIELMEGSSYPHAASLALPLQDRVLQTTASQGSASRDLFASVVPPALPAVQTVAQAAPSLTLVGTGIGPPSFAILRATSTGQREKVTLGTKVDGWAVVEIRKNEVVVEQNEARWVIGFAPVQPRICSSKSCT